jgi:formylglycine-generating enzyme required for sulfatase activity
MRFIVTIGISAVASAALAAEPSTPGATFKDCADCPEMVFIPAGSFQMGYEGGIAPDRYDGPVHPMTIRRAFALGKHEVTVAQFGAFVKATGHVPGADCSVWTGEKNEKIAGKTFADPGYATPPKPNDAAGCVSWTDAKAYVDWLARTTGKPYRLATEAEWEYAAKAGATTVYPWGDDINAGCAYANMHDQASKAVRPYEPVTCNDGFAGIAPVGSLKPNAFGLHDMVGNVYEWLQDCWVIPYGVQPTDGTSYEVSGECHDRIVRSSAWHSQQRYHRPSFRGRDKIDLVNQMFGARVARDLP